MISVRIVSAGVLFLVFVPSTPAGYYSSIDRGEETLYSRDFDTVFLPALVRLRLIPQQKLPPDKVFPMYQRYLLIESMARDGKVNFDLLSLEQKLNYSTVLIRRGNAEEAVQLLRKEAEDSKHFLLLSHYASALFLSSQMDLKKKASYFMKKSLANWPEDWKMIPEERKAFILPFGLDKESCARYRRYETYFKRLIDNRLKEDTLRAKNLPVPDGLDPIFADDPGAIRFLNEKGEFEPGRIAQATKELVPRDAVEAVEQLLIWMPEDDRLMWLLGETFNASAMWAQGRDQKEKDKEKNQAIMSALQVFNRMLDLEKPTKYGFREVKTRHDILLDYMNKLPPEPPFVPPPEVDPDLTQITKQEWWRTVAVTFIMGFFIGIAALWQLQEVRRRRQARS